MNPSEARATARNRAGGLVGGARNTVAHPPHAAAAPRAAPSSPGRPGTMTPLMPLTRAARTKDRGLLAAPVRPNCAIGFQYDRQTTGTRSRLRIAWIAASTRAA